MNEIVAFSNLFINSFCLTISWETFECKVRNVFNQREIYCILWLPAKKNVNLCFFRFNPIAFTTAVECRFLDSFSSQSYFASTTAEPQYSMICCSFISQNAKCSQLFFLLRISRFPFSTVIWHFHGPCMHAYYGRIINYKSLYSLTN